jgi:hypothetical protein
MIVKTSFFSSLRTGGPLENFRAGSSSVEILLDGREEVVARKQEDCHTAIIRLTKSSAVVPVANEKSCNMSGKNDGHEHPLD